MIKTRHLAEYLKAAKKEEHATRVEFRKRRMDVCCPRGLAHERLSWIDMESESRFWILKEWSNSHKKYEMRR